VSQQPTVSAAPPAERSAVAQVSPAAERSAAAQASPALAQAPAADGGSYPGPYFLGRAEAPVVLEEYADFQ
jgi:hypothetical protein